MTVTVRLPFVKETAGAIRYGLPASQRKEVLVSDIYVRKDKMREAGHTGEWPLALNITVEVPQS